ncbi:sugar transferase [Oleisolibacter albus]|uniref:sugar transferase n=1 Tax=Oleisolibacter albus TaxID=2171757 RepID=UPI000DF4195D|nr:sugar transferase [Oleisolibacter albus]
MTEPISAVAVDLDGFSPVRLSGAEDEASADDRPLHRQRTKRVFDLIGAVLLLLLFAPVMLVVAALVGRDGGPILFRQTRIGAGGRSFTCLKFRTMVVDAEARLQALLAADPAAREEWQRIQKLKSDPRITPVGRFLRRSSLDELPQLFNVLRGDMSLVGPRPIVAAEVVRYADWFEQYMACRPGLTGLWQISSRNDTDYDRRVELDNLYRAHWSVWTDVIIAVRTAKVLVAPRGAY